MVGCVRDGCMWGWILASHSANWVGRGHNLPAQLPCCMKVHTRHQLRFAWRCLAALKNAPFAPTSAPGVVARPVHPPTNALLLLSATSTPGSSSSRPSTQMLWPQCSQPHSPHTVQTFGTTCDANSTQRSHPHRPPGPKTAPAASRCLPLGVSPPRHPWSSKIPSALTSSCCPPWCPKKSRWRRKARRR